MFRSVLGVCLFSVLALAAVGCGDGGGEPTTEPPPDIEELRQQYNEAGRYGPGDAGAPGAGGGGGGPAGGHGR